MPQISKIRIVNFNYNDGNRFIPDELYDLASPDTGKALNTLFNLNNGGGKTVLVQLMMQGLCTRRAKNYLEIAMNQDIADSELGDYLHALNPNRSLPRNKKGLKRLLNVDI